MDIDRKEHLNLRELGDIISNRFKAVSQANESELKYKVAGYLSFLKEQYEMGILGYIAYPYNVVALMKVDKVYNKIPEVEEIIDIATTLEMPDDFARISKAERIASTEKMNNLIDDFANGIMKDACD